VTRRPTRLALLLVLGACTEHATAPGVCPEYCPGGQIAVVDTIFTDMIVRDSAFSGYFEATQGRALAVADVPGMVDSRAIFRLNGAIPDRVRNRPNPDTTTVPITVDSAQLQLNIIRRDTATKNLWIKVYRLPLDLDSTTTFAQLVPAFTDSIVDSVNLSALLARPEITDTVTVRIWGDTIQTDSAGHVLRVGADSTLILTFEFDTTQARYVAADSGTIAYGVRVSADTLASIGLGSMETSDRSAIVKWFYTYPDTNAAPVQATVQRASSFDSFVFTPPQAPVDSNLAVGGAPAARSLLRVAIPGVLRDSADVVRATLILVPVGPVPGAAGDSFTVIAQPVVADLGAKSPLSLNNLFYGFKNIHLNAADTVRMELTDLIRAWALDTSATTAIMLLQSAEASTYAQIRFYSTRAPAFKPTLHVTYVRRYPFGTP
jgi:hypothetical protein